MEKAVDKVADLIRESGVPGFVKSAQKIAELTESDDVDMSALCDVILKDTGMTTRLLRATNSAYNVRRGRTNTVSRAVVMLGVKEVRNICLASELVDGFLKDDARPELVHELVRAFYAAVQARLIAIQSRDRHSEEVFLAALVQRLGRVAFWTLNGELQDRLAEALETTDEDPVVVEQRILGFSLDELSEKVVEHWGLGNLIPGSSSEDPLQKLRCDQVTFSNRLATVSSRGWDSELVAEVVEVMSDQLAMDQSIVRSLVDRSVKETEETATSYGLEEALAALPEMIDDERLEEIRGKLLSEFKSQEVDVDFQAECFRKLAELQANGSDIRMILFEVLQGMSRGLGLDRVVFALVNEQRTLLSARLVNAPDQTILMKKFKFRIQQNEKDFFSEVYIDGSARWFDPEDGSGYESLMPQGFAPVLNSPPFFLAPVIVNDNWIACFYGDRAVSGRELNQEIFEIFCKFVLQAQLALARDV